MPGPPGLGPASLCDVVHSFDSLPGILNGLGKTVGALLLSYFRVFADVKAC